MGARLADHGLRAVDPPHTLGRPIKFRPQKNIYRVGWTLVAHSVFFTVVVSLLFVLNH